MNTSQVEKSANLFVKIDYDITSIIIEPSFFVRAHMHLHNETIFAVTQDAYVAAENNGEQVEEKEVKLNVQVCVSEHCNFHMYAEC